MSWIRQDWCYAIPVDIDYISERKGIRTENEKEENIIQKARLLRYRRVDCGRTSMENVVQKQYYKRSSSEYSNKSSFQQHQKLSTFLFTPKCQGQDTDNRMAFRVSLHFPCQRSFPTMNMQSIHPESKYVFKNRFNTQRIFLYNIMQYHLRLSAPPPSTPVKLRISDNGR